MCVAGGWLVHPSAGSGSRVVLSLSLRVREAGRLREFNNNNYIVSLVPSNIKREVSVHHHIINIGSEILSA